MTIATIGGGQQIGNGNTADPLLYSQAAPVAKTAAATLTAAEITSGLISYTGSAANLTLPLATDLDTLLSGAKTDSYFDFWVIDLAGAGRATIVTNTGWTLVGTMASLSGLGVQFRARKTGVGTWTLYRLA